MKMLTTAYGFERKNAPNETRQIELELESDSAFGIIHRRRMFILVSLFQKILTAKVFCFKGDNDRQLTGNLFWSEFEHFSPLKEKSRAGGRGACIRGITSLNPRANHERKNERFVQRTEGIVERILTGDS